MTSQVTTGEIGDGLRKSPTVEHGVPAHGSCVVGTPSPGASLPEAMRTPSWHDTRLSTTDAVRSANTARQA